MIAIKENKAARSSKRVADMAVGETGLIVETAGIPQNGGKLVIRTLYGITELHPSYGHSWTFHSKVAAPSFEVQIVDLEITILSKED